MTENLQVENERNRDKRGVVAKGDKTERKSGKKEWTDKQAGCRLMFVQLKLR